MHAGIRSLRLLRANLKENGQVLVLANPSRRVHNQMTRGKLMEDFGDEWIFVNPAEAVKKCSSLVAVSREGNGQDDLAKATTDVSLSLPASPLSWHSVQSGGNDAANEDGQKFDGPHT
jgi:hypothetical protein